MAVWPKRFSVGLPKQYVQQQENIILIYVIYGYIDSKSLLMILKWQWRPSMINNVSMAKRTGGSLKSSLDSIFHKDPQRPIAAMLLTTWCLLDSLLGCTVEMSQRQKAAVHWFVGHAVGSAIHKFLSKHPFGTQMPNLRQFSEEFMSWILQLAGAICLGNPSARQLPDRPSNWQALLEAEGRNKGTELGFLPGLLTSTYSECLPVHAQTVEQDIRAIIEVIETFIHEVPSAFLESVQLGLVRFRSVLDAHHRNVGAPGSPTNSEDFVWYSRSAPFGFEDDTNLDNMGDDDA